MLLMWSKIRKSLHIKHAVISGLVLFGLALRLRQYLIGRSLWLDEAMLALNILRRDFAGLFQPLDDHQGAPVGFLLLEKLVVTLLGNHELTLRLIPLMAGCAALPLFALLLRQGLGKTGRLTALALFAAGAPLVYYASEVKQYSLDVLIAILLLWLAGEALATAQTTESNDRRKFVKIRGIRVSHILLACVGIVAVWCSHPAVFVLAGVGMTLLLHDLFARDARQLRTTLAMIALWVASFALLYFASLRELSANTFLHEYWVNSFMPLPPWSDWN